MTDSSVIPQHQFKAEIDMARTFPRQHQLCCGAADGVAVNADGAEACIAKMTALPFDPIIKGSGETRG
jgi:hypothetical protein